jgi:hypothetical protein
MSYDRSSYFAAENAEGGLMVEIYKSLTDT